MTSTLRKSLNLREGEGRLLVALCGFLFLTVAGETLLTSSRNSLFLSVFDARRIAEVMVGAAILSAVAALAFTGVMAQFRRRTLALGLLVFLSSTLVVAFLAFRSDERTAYGIYLWVQAVEVLILTHAWDYMGDLLTGRQAKRILPLAGAGASVAAVVGGLSVGPLARATTAEGLLWVAAALLVGSLAFLWVVPEPGEDDLEVEEGSRGLRGLLERSARGFRNLGSHRLLRLLAAATVLLVLMSTLIDFQWKVAVKELFVDAEEMIATVFGLMQAAIGLGALALQLVASRVLFPRLGISRSNLLQAGSVALLAVGVALYPVFLLVAALRFLDEALGEAVEKPAQQITLIPFPPRTKNAAFATLDGVLRPLAQAAGAFGALLLVNGGRSDLMPWIIAGLGGVSFLVLTGHRSRYLATLEEALSRHLVDLRALGAGRLTVDREVLGVVDRFLGDDDPTVVVFALSLLRDLPASETASRALPLLDHPVPEVRMAAAGTLGVLNEDPGGRVNRGLSERLAEEGDPEVMGSLLVALGSLGQETGEADLGPFIEHPEPAVRRAALTALAESHPDAVRSHLEQLLAEGGASDREAALSVVGTLGYAHFLPAVTAAVLDDDVRPAALQALAAFGEAALPALDRLIQRRELPLPVRRTLVTTLAGIDDDEAREMLLRLVHDDELGPAALTSLRRLRSSGRMGRLEPGTLRHLLRAEVERGARYALVGVALEERDLPADVLFVIREMEELRIRHVHRTLAVLSLGYDADGVANAESAIFSDDASRKSNALEFLEGSLTPEDAGLAVPLAEWERGEPLEPLERLTVEAPRALAAPLELLAEDDRWWPRTLARYAYSFTDGGNDFMIPLIEKVMLLKGSELFRGFPGDELAGIAELSTEEHAEAGEVIFEQGAAGDAYYLVVRGSVSIVRDGHELAVLGPREGFGEMAILDQETRSATARAAEPATLLVLDRDSFDQLVERNPAIARGIYRVLTQRLRNTLARIAAGT